MLWKQCNFFLISALFFHGIMVAPAPTNTVELGVALLYYIALLIFIKAAIKSSWAKAHKIICCYPPAKAGGN
jgi:hypothetical protein